MKQWLIATIVVFLVSGCSTLQVEIDSDPGYDFASLSKFNVIYTKKNDDKDFSRSRFSKMLTAYFQEKGYVAVDKGEADFYLIFHLDITQKSEIETNYETMDLHPRVDYYNRRPYPPGGMPGIYADPYRYDDRRTVATTRTYDYEEGRLVIELLDVKQNAVVWQGIAQDELSNLPTQEAKTAYIQKVLDKLFADFPSKTLQGHK